MFNEVKKILFKSENVETTINENKQKKLFFMSSNYDIFLIFPIKYTSDKWFVFLTKISSVDSSSLIG